MSQESTRIWTALRRVRGAVLPLREIRTLRQLLDATPAALCRVGFDRAMVSHSTSPPGWWSGSTASSTARTAQINEVAQTTPQRLSPSLFETDMLRRRAPILVTEAQHDARVSRPFAEATLSTSYVAAPIMPDGRVIGFLHADHYHRRVEVDRFDLEVLSYFAEQFGHVLERTLLLERLDVLRQSIGTLTEALNETVNDCRYATIHMSPDDAHSPAAMTAPLQTASNGFRRPTLAPDQVLTAVSVKCCSSWRPVTPTPGSRAAWWFPKAPSRPTSRTSSASSSRPTVPRRCAGGSSVRSSPDQPSLLRTLV